MPSCAMDQNFEKIHALQGQLKSFFKESLPPWEWTLLNLFLLAGFRFQKANWIQFGPPSPLPTPSLKEFFTNQNLKDVLKNFLSEEDFQKFSFYFHKTRPQDFFWSSALQGRWKQLPQSSQKSLIAWSTGNYPLILFSKALSPLEMAQLQSQGNRAVTVFESLSDLKLVHEHYRDAYLFTIHDLEHAEHFFAHQRNPSQQVRISQLIRESFLNPGPYKAWISSELSQDYEYLISDMNTHPWHLYLTLQTLLLKSHKLQGGHPVTKPLSPPDEHCFQDKIKTLMANWQLSYPPQASDFQSLI